MKSASTHRNQTKDHSSAIERIAERAAIRAIKGSDHSLYKAVSALALNLCGQQIRATLSNGIYDPAADKYVFRKLLYTYAMNGLMVWQGTEREVEAISAAPPNSKERQRLAIEYVRMKNQKAVRLVAELRTQAFRLANYMRFSQSQQIIQCARANSPETAVAMWERAVADQFGTSFNKLESGLASLLQSDPTAFGGMQKRKSRQDPEPVVHGAATTGEARVAEIMLVIKGLSDEEFAALTTQIAAHAIVRRAQT